MIGGRVLDTSALVGLATGRSQYGLALVWTAVERGIVLAVPTAALAQACLELPPRLAQSLHTLLAQPVTVVEILTAPVAFEIGDLPNDESEHTVSLTVAHVVWSAKHRGWPVVTAEPEAVRSLNPEVKVERLP